MRVICLWLRIRSTVAEADIYLHGAQVTSWHPAGAEEVIFLSRHSRFEEGKAIRGGIPVCFPWFRAKADNTAGSGAWSCANKSMAA